LNSCTAPHHGVALACTPTERDSTEPGKYGPLPGWPVPNARAPCPARAPVVVMDVEVSVAVAV
jgi:hypothetical protein